MKSLVSLGTLTAALLVGQGAFAQTAAVTSSLTAQRVEMVDGKAVLKPMTDARPGDVIEYAGTYRNGGSAAVNSLLAVVPVPTGTTLVAGSLTPAAAQASTDGATFAPMPLMRTVRQPDGSERRVAVPLSDYRAVRWEIGTLAPARSTVVSLRVRLDTPVATAPASAPKP